MLQSHYSLFDSFFAPQRILVVSEERLKQAEMEAIKATPGIMKAPMLDPSKNPQIAEQPPQ